MNSFRDFIASLGIIPPSVVIPGKWLRCATLSHPRKKNASVKLADGEQIGWAHDFATMAEPSCWRADSEARITPINKDEIKSRIEAKRRELINATREARAFYEACEPLRNSHPYLSAKGLSMIGCEGLKTDKRGDLVVPMCIRGKLVSVQRITEDGTKLFWSGATTNGASYILSRRGHTITLVCEGLATGLTLYASVPNCRVIVAFNAGNLVRAVAHHDIHGLCVVCADNDAETAERIGKNPGMEGAQRAADAIGCGIAIPACDEGTDFDDWRQELLIKERRDNMFRSWKYTDAQMLANVHAEIRACVMASLKFVALDT